MAKTKKRQHRKDLESAVAIDGDEFPAEITVELWQRRPKGKRTLVGSRRYELAADLPEATHVAETAGVAPVPAVSGDGVEKAPAAPPPAKNRARQARQAPPLD